MKVMTYALRSSSEEDYVVFVDKSRGSVVLVDSRTNEELDLSILVIQASRGDKKKLVKSVLLKARTPSQAAISLKSLSGIKWFEVV